MGGWGATFPSTGHNFSGSGTISELISIFPALGIEQLKPIVVFVQVWVTMAGGLGAISIKGQHMTDYSYMLLHFSSLCKNATLIFCSRNRSDLSCLCWGIAESKSGACRIKMLYISLWIENKRAAIQIYIYLLGCFKSSSFSRELQVLVYLILTATLARLIEND